MKMLLLSCLAFGPALSAVAAEEPSPEAIRAAVAKSLPLLELGAKTSKAERKECFTCHNQGLPMMAMVVAKRKGFAIDDSELKSQLQFTAEFLAKNRDRYREGKGQAGQTFMAGYALWALKSGDWPADETTAAVAEYFLQYQSDRDHWTCHTHRPPSEASDFTANFFGLFSLEAYGTAEQQERIAARRAQVLEWLRNGKPKDTEDRVFSLRSLRLAGAHDSEVDSATGDLLATQQSDGGWAQAAEMASDAYATGTALVALHQAGGLPVDDERYRKGLAFLLQTQLEDGSWHVGSRSEPFQTYFESGYPHGEDQFISIASGAWATMALTLALPDAAR
jgi:hypothetical protein